MTCSSRFCDEPATTTRGGEPMCADDAAEHDWFVEHYPAGAMTVEAS